MAWVISGNLATSSEVAEASPPMGGILRVRKITLTLTADHTAANGIQVREGTNVLLDTTEMEAHADTANGARIVLDYGGKGQDFLALNFAEVGTGPGQRITVEWV